MGLAQYSSAIETIAELEVYCDTVMVGVFLGFCGVDFLGNGERERSCKYGAGSIPKRYMVSITVGGASMLHPKLRPTRHLFTPTTLLLVRIRSPGWCRTRPPARVFSHLAP